MKKTLVLLLLPFIAQLAHAQGRAQTRPVTPPQGNAATTAPAKPSILLEEWSKEPALHKIDKKYSTESAIVLLDKRRMEFVDEANNELSVYRTLHKIIRVNDDRGIATFNRVYLGVTDNSDIIDIRARTILPDGRIIEIDKNNIKDMKEEDGNMYKIFAMDGLEKGCEVEYYYTYKRDASFFGRETIQNPFPVLDAQLQILCPARLVFEMKGYNCSIDPNDTTIDGKRWLSAGLKEIGGAQEEKYAAYEVNLQKIEYKLSHNEEAHAGVRLFTWNELAKRAYTLYTSYTEKELKKTDGLVSGNKWAELGSDKEKIAAVENYLKKNFTTREDIHSEDAENIEMIIKTRIASHRGIIRLYGAIFDKLGVQHQFVLACDRNESVIDKNFENWNTPDNTILYFPGTGKFMAPTLLQTRYPWINPFWGAANGLYLKGTTIGNFTTAIAEIKPIPLEDYSQSYSGIESKVSMNAGNDTLLVDMQQRFAGYSGGSYRADFTLATAEDQKAILKQMVRFGTNNSENTISSEVKNTDFESYSDNKPFILHAVVKANELVERAGSKVLVKVGELIGPQSQMYQERPRQFPIQMPFPHVEERNIDLALPEGYAVKNLGDLSINIVYMDKGDTTMGFTSAYRLEGNTVKIHVLEQYRRVNYPLSAYEDFKKVINASADFNKIVLVLVKK
jgi:hypothetical protein